jgi:aconitate hydratase
MLSDGSLVIAAITSCTNTSNPGVMIGAGLLAKKAVEKGLNTKPWVKTSLAPGSKVVTRYLEKSYLLPFLEALGFHVVGYGCTTCIGNTGPLPGHISKAISDNDLIVGAILSGNRNYEARIHPQIKMNFLASPLLVVAYAIAGRIDINLETEPVALDKNLEPVYLKDIWPTSDEIQEVMGRVVTADDYQSNYSKMFDGDEKWQALDAPASQVYQWDEGSTYIKEAPFFQNISDKPEAVKDISGARVLLKLGDSVTTDHISPAGSIGETSPAGQYLKSKGIQRVDFNSYGSRRGNHEVMIRGTFANVRLKNELVNREGSFTLYHPTGEVTSIYDASERYREQTIPLIILAGKEYGSGSSRDWAAKGAALLGVRAIIAESFERIHRSNLVGMGVLPLQFLPGQSVSSLELKGDEIYELSDLDEITPGKVIPIEINRSDGSTSTIQVTTRLDSTVEVLYYQNGGILQYVLRNFLAMGS